MDQIERISDMERRMTRALKAVRALDSALNAFELVQGDIQALDEYYGSEEWRQDFAADEAGLLPRDLKRGVLSEDGIWNVLADSHELDVRLSEMVTEVLRRG
jgi:hypothetical protein